MHRHCSEFKVSLKYDVILNMESRARDYNVYDDISRNIIWSHIIDILNNLILRLRWKYQNLLGVDENKTVQSKSNKL